MMERAHESAERGALELNARSNDDETIERARRLVRA